MRQIEKEMVDAINAKRDFSKSNTQVTVDGNKAVVRLFGNTIAMFNYKTGTATLINDGYLWDSTTTHSRQNAFLNGLGFRTKVCRRNYDSYLITTDLRLVAMKRFNLISPAVDSRNEDVDSFNEL